MSNWRTTFRAEDSVNRVAGSAHSSPALGWAFDGQLVLGDDSDESYGGTVSKWGSRWPIK